MEKFYSKVDLGNIPRTLSKGEYPLTSNIVIRRDLFNDIGGFRTDLGHVGNILIGGEDVELIDRIHASGQQIFYEPKAVVHHHIPEERQTRKWLIRRCYYGGTSTPILDDLKQVSLKEVFYNFRQAIILSTKACWFVLMKQPSQSMIYGCNSATRLGRAVGLVRLIHKL